MALDYDSLGRLIELVGCAYRKGQDWKAHCPCCGGTGLAKVLKNKGVGMLTPTVGRIVHYVNLGDKDGKYPPQVQAAVITGVYKRDPDGVVSRANDGIGQSDITEVDLKVFYKTELFDCEKVPLRQNSEQRGCWDWPPKI